MSGRGLGCGARAGARHAAPPGSALPSRGRVWDDLREASLQHNPLGQFNGPSPPPSEPDGGVKRGHAEGAAAHLRAPSPSHRKAGRAAAHDRQETRRTPHRSPLSAGPARRVRPRRLLHHPAAPPAPRRDAPPAPASPRPEPAPPRPHRKGLSDRARKWLVALLLIAAFSGMLLATHFYFRREPRQSQPPAAPGAQAGRVSPVGREFVATSDVNLRVQPSGQLVGKVPQGSVVKVQAVSGGWYQIQILQFKRPKEKASDADQGWADKDFFTERQ